MAFVTHCSSRDLLDIRTK